MKIIAVSFLAFLVTGCAGFGMGGMSAAEITAAIKDKSSSAVCTEYIGTGGKFTALYTNTDKSTLQTGGGSTTVKCGDAEVTFTDSGKGQKAAP
jgi:hypothetical protein